MTDKGSEEMSRELLGFDRLRRTKEEREEEIKKWLLKSIREQFGGAEGGKVDARNKDELREGTARAMVTIRHLMPELKRNGIMLGQMSFCSDSCGETRPCKSRNRCLLVPKIKISRKRWLEW